MAEKAREYLQITSDFVKLDKVGDVVEGYLVAVLMEVPVKDRTRPVVVLKTEEGITKKIPMGESVKADLPGLAKDHMGDYCRISLAGLQPSGKGNATKIFKIEVAKAE